MKPPATYSEWTQALDLFRQGNADDELLNVMESGSFEWTPIVSERFVACLRSTIDARLDQLQRRQKGLATRANSERDIVAYLLSYRREFGLLKRLASVPAIRKDISESFSSMIAQCANQAQEALEESATQDRSGKLVVLVRKTRVDAF